MFAAQQQWSSAIGCFARILALKPADARAQLQLSYIHSLAGNYRTAKRYAMEAHAASPVAPEVLAELVARLRTFNEASAVRSCLTRLLPLERISIPLLLAFANQFSMLNLQDEALRLLDEAKRGDPEFPPTLAARAQVLVYLGRFDEAERELQRGLAKAPRFAKLYWLRSRLRRSVPCDNQVDKISAQLSTPGRSADDVALLAFALHKELDDLGDYERAWGALEAACRAKRSLLNYRTADSKQLIEALIRMPPLPAASVEPAPARMPVFIVGMHRSGTTLLERVMAGHSQVSAMGELYDFTAQLRLASDHHCRGVLDARIVEMATRLDYAAIGRGYMDGCEWRANRRHFIVDKLPSNFLNIAFIQAAMPHARVLHMVRDPMETCFSNLRELFSDACAYSYDQLELADYYGLYFRLMAHWRRAYPTAMLDVSYDDITTNPESAATKVADYCGLDYQPAMIDIDARVGAVSTASAVQVRGGIRSMPVPKWRAYQRWLQPLADRLAKNGVFTAPALNATR